MNKKFSTLMASLLLAGGAFSNVWAETFTEATAGNGHEGKYYIVKVNGGQRNSSNPEANKQYVQPISQWNMLSVTSAASVSASAEVTEAELWSIVVTESNKYQLVNALTGEALKAGGFDAFEGNDVALWFNSSSKKGYNGSATDVDCKNTTEDSDQVWGYDLQETSYKAASSVVSGAISASQPYLLMGGLVDSEVLVDSNEDGKASFGSYVKDEYKSYWYVVVDRTQKVATFKNKKSGKTLTDRDGKTIYAKVNSDLTFDDNGNIDLYVVGGPAEAYTSVALGVVNSSWYNFTASDLMSITGAGFQMDIKKHEDGGSKDKELAGNPFVGLLKTVKWKNNDCTTGVVVSADPYTTYNMLQNEDGNLIVVDLNQKYAETDAGTKYALTVISPKVLANSLASSKAEERNRYAYEFGFQSSNAFEIGVDQVVEYIDAYCKDGNYYQLGTITLSGTPTLSAEVGGGAPFLDGLTIKIGTFNTIDVKKLLGNTPAFFTVTNVNTKAKYSDNYGKVLGLKDTDNAVYAAYAAYIKSDEALVGYPETQWAITLGEEDGKDAIILANRERPSITKTYKVSQLYKVAGKENVFAVLDAAKTDTIEFKANTNYTDADGFLRLNAAELRDQSYYVAASSSVYDNVAYLVENHGKNHQVGLDTDKANATEWNLAASMFRGLNNLGETIEYRPDTIQVTSTLGYVKDGAITSKQVKLKMLAYSFQNDENSEYLAYVSGESNRYATGAFDAVKGYTEKADANIFVIKVVGEDIYNLIPLDGVDAKDVTTADARNWESLATQKMYSGDGATKGILNNTEMYNQTENDLFVIEKKDAPEYRKVAMADTISIFRNEDAQDVLFEKGEFLGTATSTGFEKANPALFVDTAYVNRPYNNRWEYLLAVNAKHWESKEDCGVEGHPKHEADTTTGRFLVNLMDSAYVYNETNLHNNKFINEEDGQKYAKLGFVEGYHTHDTLYLKRPNGTYDKIAMDREDYSHSIAKFAFRYVDQNEGSFVIETGYKDWNFGEPTSEVKTGYLKWLNGTLVVVKDIEAAEIFNMNEDESRTPTANEAISAGNVVVAGTNGAVVVKGAEGKNVIVSTILGKVVANEVVSSDNAQIATPAGIVVVSVDGESFKVVVK